MKDAWEEGDRVDPTVDEGISDQGRRPLRVVLTETHLKSKHLGKRGRG